MEAFIRELIESSVGSALRVIAQHSREHFQADLALIVTAAAGGHLRVEIALGGVRHGEVAGNLLERPVALDGTVAGRVYAGQVPILVAGRGDEPLLDLRAGPFRGSAMVIPLRVPGLADAVLLLVRAGGSSMVYAAQDLDALMALATDAYAVARTLRERARPAGTARPGVSVEAADVVAEPAPSALIIVGPVEIRTLRDPGNRIVVAALAGWPSLKSTPVLRATLLKLAAEASTALLLDLSGLHESRRWVSVLPTIARLAWRDYGVPVIMYAAHPDLARKLRTFRMYVELHEDQQAAVAAARTWTQRWVSVWMRPEPTAPATARKLVGDCCLHWDLPDVLHQARAIISELVGNAVVHAGTDINVSVSAYDRYLRLAVRDHSSVLPPRCTGPSREPLSGDWHGLDAITALATHWNATPRPGGKVVWAMIRTDQLPR